MNQILFDMLIFRVERSQRCLVILPAIKAVYWTAVSLYFLFGLD